MLYLLPICEKYLLKAEAIDLGSLITKFSTIIFDGGFKPFGVKVISSLIPAHIFFIFLLFARKYE